MTYFLARAIAAGVMRPVASLCVCVSVCLSVCPSRYVPYLSVASLLSGDALVSINEVTLRWARLVLGWVTVSGVQLLVRGNLSRYITSHPCQLSLAIPPWVGVMSTSQRAVMLCGWGVKAGIVHEWVAGKTV